MEHNFKISCSKENLKEVRRFVNAVLSGYPISESEKNMITLAVDEVCANLIIHSHKCNPKEFITLNIFEQKGMLVFEIIDDGDSFNLLQHEEQSLYNIVKQKRKGGLGIMLVKRIMDDIQIYNAPDHNVCRLYKKI
ncbi:MAG TPA: ATP-binding protein [Cytophagales bacterium]|nr:ATP-binding protein [Cytophagales bacterium]